MGARLRSVLPGNLMQAVLSRVRRHWFSGVLLLVAAALAAQNVSLSRVNRDIRTRLDWLVDQQVKPGNHVGKLTGSGLDGQQLTASALGNRRSLLIGLSAYCSICADTMPVWRRLVAQARRMGGVQVVWVSRDTTTQMRQFTAGQPVNGSVIADPTHLTYLELKLGIVPQTVITDTTGLVIAAHTGPIDGRTEEELLAALESGHK